MKLGVYRGRVFSAPVAISGRAAWPLCGLNPREALGSRRSD